MRNAETTPRDRMVDAQIAGRGIGNSRVLAAMRSVSREQFVDPGYEEFAYEDSPLPIGEGQTISQPYMVALMIETAEIEPGDRVLEIGAGSGYAAAVIGKIAEQVHAIERHAALAEIARARMERLGYRNIAILKGDGSSGLPDQAPFDAILVAAGSPSVPVALQEQLEIGGRLVIPVGRQGDRQTLLRITRTGARTWEEEEIAAVAFVPLIGEYAWNETGDHPASPTPVRKKTLSERVAEAAEPVPQPAQAAFGALFDRFASRRVVLLGEASHGTAEFYRARAAITRHLIERHGFDFVAVEADWPDAAVLDRHVRGLENRDDTLPPFQRFPTWMWRNTEIARLIQWMRGYNLGVEPRRRAGFHGLDMYNMRASIAAVLSYLDRTDTEAAKVARERYGCLTPWQNDPAAYGRMALSGGYRGCEHEVVKQCRDLLENRLDYAVRSGDDFIDAVQNARLIASAERYYRAMFYGGAETWNLRDTHMFETLEHLLEARGPDAKAVVWAHNSHIGDARHTDMGRLRGELNLGQLCRERFGDDVASVGLGTHSGTVAAATDWGGPMEVKTVRPSHEDSYERICHKTRMSRFLLDMAEGSDIGNRLAEPRMERFIGVIYRPETELQSHYARASLSRQFDAWLWFDETRALTPLGPEHAPEGAADTWPFGL